MSKSLLKSLVRPMRQSVDGATKSDQSTAGSAVLRFGPTNRQRRQDALSMASYLVSRLEKKDYAPAVNELYKLTPEDRVSVAEKMLWINKQHRSIITSLPLFDCSFMLSDDGRKDLESIQISDVGSHGLAKNTFCFSADTCHSASY